MPEQNTPIAVTPVMLDRERMAAALCISTDLLDRLRGIGLPSVNVPTSTKVLFDPDDVKAWLKANQGQETLSGQAAKAKADAIFRRTA